MGVGGGANSVRWENPAAYNNQQNTHLLLTSTDEENLMGRFY